MIVVEFEKTEQLSCWALFHLSPKTAENFMFTVNPLSFWKISKPTHPPFFFLCPLKTERRRRPPLIRRHHWFSSRRQLLHAAPRAAYELLAALGPPSLASCAHATLSPSRHITAAAAGKLLPPLELAHGLAELIPFPSMLILPSSSLYIVTTDPSLLTQGRRPL